MCPKAAVSARAESLARAFPLTNLILKPLASHEHQRVMLQMPRGNPGSVPGNYLLPTHVVRLQGPSLPLSKVHECSWLDYQISSRARNSLHDAGWNPQDCYKLHDLRKLHPPHPPSSCRSGRLRSALYGSTLQTCAEPPMLLRVRQPSFQIRQSKVSSSATKGRPLVESV